MEPTSCLPRATQRKGDFRYLVQFPLEYDPMRRYPVLIVLNGAFNSPLQELEFWTGTPPLDEENQPIGQRQWTGHAARLYHGVDRVAQASPIPL